MIYIFDFDGTLCNTQERPHLVGDWDSWHEASLNDSPRKEIVNIYDGIMHTHLTCDVQVGILTAKPDKFARKIMHWLNSNGIGYPDFLICRKNDNKDKSCELKIKLIDENFPGVPRQNIIAFDDRQDVIDSFLSNSIVGIKV